MDDEFFRTPLGIILAAIFFPFFFTYWVYKRDWKPKAKWAFMLVFWSLVFIAAMTNTPQKEAVISPPPSRAPAIPVSDTSPSPAITITDPIFDKNLGNNYISAKYAKQYMDFAAKVAPGAIKAVYLELTPSDPAGMTDSFLTVTVNSFYWNTANDSTKKNLIAAAIKELKNTFSVYPHITITDGTKTLATGELPSLSGDPVITLK